MRSITIIKRDSKGRILCTGKLRPSWATEPQLNRMLLLPALRQVTAVQMFYQQGMRTADIGRQLGMSIPAVRTLLMRVRKALGIGRDDTRSEMLRLAPKKLISRHDQFANGFGKIAKRWGSKGRHYHPIISDDKLRMLFLQPALERLEVAKLYWIQGLTAKQVAAQLKINYRSVEFQIARIRRLTTNPAHRQNVMRSTTKSGKKRTGVSAVYIRSRKKVPL